MTPLYGTSPDREERLRNSADTIAVTGGSGKIGRRVIAQLLQNGFKVRATTSNESLPSEHLNPDVDWIHLDFRQTLDFRAFLNGCSAVIHLAAEMQDPALMQRSNVDATRALVAASEEAGLRTFCYASSVAVY